MDSKSTSDSSEVVGVIGAGSFGTAVANLIAKNTNALVYARNPKTVASINDDRVCAGQSISASVRATNSEQELAESCRLIFPIVPSDKFRSMIRDFSPYLNPNHVLIHGTKGLDVQLNDNEDLFDLQEISRTQISTMSEVIQQETSVVRLGNLAGPNLSGELAQDQPAGSLIASPFDEVSRLGKMALNSGRFKIFESKDMLGAEYAGVLKNIFAIASGMVDGLGFGNNARAFLITKSLHEMLFIGQKSGANSKAFLGIAGIGDLIATCSSNLSRNYNVGRRLAEGESLSQIVATSREVAEGIRTVKIFDMLTKAEGIQAPITNTLAEILFADLSPETALIKLMSFNFSQDVTFI